MKFKNLIPLVIVLLVYQFCFASTNSVNIAGYQYVKYKNEFHVIDQYNNSYSIDTNKVIVHLKDTKQNIDDILLKINAPTLKDVRGKFAGDFIEFQIPSKTNSIQLLKQFESSGYFDVVLSVMSISGHIVKEWEFIGQNPGTYRIQWDGRKDNGQELTSGMYIYQLKTSNFLDTKKMVYMK